MWICSYFSFGWLVGEQDKKQVDEKMCDEMKTEIVFMDEIRRQYGL